MRSSQILMIFITSIILVSCDNSKTDVEYYPNSGVIKERLYYPDKNNDSTFYTTIYYFNGQVKLEGLVKDYRSEGKWTQYYSDGEFHFSMFFENGIPNFDHSCRELPRVEISDSFVINKPTYLKVINLYPDENFVLSGNAKLEHVEESLPYDYRVTPYEKGIISFYTESLFPIQIDSSCVNILSDKKFIPSTQKNIDNIRVYKKKQLKLGDFLVN